MVMVQKQNVVLQVDDSKVGEYLQQGYTRIDAAADTEEAPDPAPADTKGKK